MCEKFMKINLGSLSRFFSVNDEHLNRKAQFFRKSLDLKKSMEC